MRGLIPSDHDKVITEYFIKLNLILLIWVLFSSIHQPTFV